MNQSNSGTKRIDPVNTDTNPDPLTGTPGAHPVGTGLGAVGVGAAAGAAGGALGGPVGAVVGAAIGAVAGGLAGKAVAEAVDPTAETKYWSEKYPGMPYADPKVGYDEYAPAYRYGWESFGKRGTSGRTFESAETDLQRGWDQARGASRLGWEKARPASRDAWNRLQRNETVTATYNAG